MKICTWGEECIKLIAEIAAYHNKPEELILLFKEWFIGLEHALRFHHFIERLKLRPSPPMLASFRIYRMDPFMFRNTPYRYMKYSWTQKNKLLIGRTTHSERWSLIIKVLDKKLKRGNVYWKMIGQVKELKCATQDHRTRQIVNKSECTKHLERRSLIIKPMARNLKKENIYW